MIETCGKLIPHYQHGFISQRGTGTQILRTTKFITDALESRPNSGSVAMISTDLSKAFDSINHERLTHKLLEADIPCNMVKLIEGYLADRHITGRFRTTIGTSMRVPHGVPQGSILGPLIFNLYVHDIPTQRGRDYMMSQYADDLCILNETTQSPSFAIRRAQWAATDLIRYYRYNGLQVNVSKTECMLFTRRRNHATTMDITEEYEDGTCTITPIPIQPSIKYLGVHLDKRMSMNVHTNYVLKRARQTRGMLAPIIGYYSNTDIATKLLVIQACLLPVLDYGVVQILPRYSKTNILKLERQYRMALKSAGQFPRRIATSMLWELLDEDPWHLRISDLHRDLLERLPTMGVQDLTELGRPYLRHGQHNPTLPSRRLGDIDHLSPRERRKKTSSRSTPARPHRIH